MRQSSLRVFVLLGLVLLFLGLRVWNLGGHVPHVDETFAIGVGDQSLKGIIDTLETRDPHPPLYYVLLRGWIAVGKGIGALPDGSLTAATSEEGARGVLYFLRIPGVVLSAATFLFLYGFGRRLYDERTALCALAVFALSRLETFWAQSVRYHTLLMLLSLVATMLLYRIVEKKADAEKKPEAEAEDGNESNAPDATGQRRWVSVGYVAVSVCGLYTNYFFGLILLVHGVYVVARRKLNWGWVVRWAIVGLAFLPWLPMFFRQLGIVSGEGYRTTGVGLASIPLTLYRLVFSYGLETNTPVEGAGYFAGLAALGVLLYGGVRTNRLLVWLYAFLPMAILFVLSFRKPLFTPHYFLMTFPAYCLFLGRGASTWIGWGERWWKRRRSR